MGSGKQCIEDILGPKMNQSTWDHEKGLQTGAVLNDLQSFINVELRCGSFSNIFFLRRTERCNLVGEKMCANIFIPTVAAFPSL